jgi:GNAT superfamily N-acetyltransferase
MDVRPALKSDIPDLLPLFRGYCDFYRASPSDDGLIAMAKALIEGPDSDGMLLVARDGDGASVGFAAVGWKWSSLRGARVAVMEDLFVAPEARGRGAGSALIRACAERASELGAAAVTWLTAPDNRRARSVYEQAGATGETFIEYDLEL